MLNRMKLARGFQSFQLTNVSLPVPRLWAILLVIAYPFIVICTNFFEALERTGTLGAIIADASLPAAIISYFVLIYTLKQRKI